MDHRIAILDLGTNTFHLMIADVNQQAYRVVHRERQAVKIGMGGINKDIITEEALVRALITIEDFKKIINEFKAKDIYAFGTSALRNASNQGEVLNKIKTETGIQVKVISGEEEARLIYMGIRSALSMDKEESLIMDIGGGSVEFIIGHDSGVSWMHSFEIGAQRLVEKFHRHDPIAQEDLHQLNLYFARQLDPLFEALRKYKPTTLIGSSGTFDTLTDIFCLREGIPRSPGSAETPLSFAGFNEIYTELKIKDREARMRIPGMIELRVDMIVVACALIDYVLKTYHFEKIRVSSHALKEGVLADIIEANQSI